MIGKSGFQQSFREESGATSPIPSGADYKESPDRTQLAKRALFDFYPLSKLGPEQRLLDMSQNPIQLIETVVLEL